MTATFFIFLSCTPAEPSPVVWSFRLSQDARDGLLFGYSGTGCVIHATTTRICAKCFCCCRCRLFMWAPFSSVRSSPGLKTPSKCAALPFGLGYPRTGF